ncbi:MAG: hypothetical protein WC899_08530 [bacterium]|jgi:hypothetical protein
MTDTGRNKDGWTKILFKLFADIATIVMGITSIIMVIFAYKQLGEARRERTDASIALTVAKKAEGKIDNTYKKIHDIETKANNEFKSLVRKSYILDEDIQSVGKSLNKGMDSINNMESLSNLLELITDAQIDGRVSLERLRYLRNQKSYKYAEKAKAASEKIAFEYGHPYERVKDTIPWPDEYNPKKISLDKIKANFRDVPAYTRNIIVDIVCDNSNIVKKDKLEFLYDIIDTDPSLRVVSAAGNCFNKTANIENNRVYIEAYREWWKYNKDKI